MLMRKYDKLSIIFRNLILIQDPNRILLRKNGRSYLPLNFYSTMNHLRI
ncbi:hypothetical protein Natoc_2268 [Natronococcus occultus SP4]|uniref:Uncharacterized protein n=1 Tax=Natronococcus occultus SP4 TaxID=694430 RepID=L0JZ57_9EURY|nr:hypothetical protein Natoc_2268 [Natronococcus occultus SP4]